MRFTLVRLYAKHGNGDLVTFANLTFPEELSLEDAMEQAFDQVKDECVAPFVCHDVLILDDQKEGAIVKVLYDEKDLQ